MKQLISDIICGCINVIGIALLAVGAMMASMIIVARKLDRYDTDRYVALDAKITPHDAKDEQ